VLQTPTEQIHRGRDPACDQSHSCLSGKQDCRCRVLQLVDNAILAVSPPPEMKCSHKMRYRDAFLCTCPVRKETYKRYKI
jgi:hypothetical protein